jgi:TetR/AcrR family transcriptional regulator, transcriptional repressor for nem operon
MMIIMYPVNRLRNTKATDMRVSREQAVANRERILDVASRLFRERGLDGIGVADLMKEAGLTHGGFYGHFASKEELMALACERTLAASATKWGKLCARAEGKPLSAIAKSYLSTRHRDDPGKGCAVAAIAAEASRHGSNVRHAFTKGVCTLVEVLAGAVPGKSRTAKRRKALIDFSSMVGALVLARAVDDAKLSNEILEAVSASIEATAV